MLKRNITANFIGNAWSAIVQVGFIPLYIHFMGAASYGLVGVFATIQATFAMLDLGLGASVNREMAKHSARSDQSDDIRDLLRTFEVVYWAIALLIGSLLALAAPFLAHHWLRSDGLSPELVQSALWLMSINAALQFPATFYTSGLMGLQRQVTCNVINIGTTTLRGLGAILALWLISPSVLMFFTWQVFAALVHTLVAALTLWKSLPAGSKQPQFSLKHLMQSARFAAGMGAVTFLGIAVSQVDKVFLSKFVPLEAFGYYTLAGTAASGISRLVGPVTVAIQPRLTQLVTLGRDQELREIYHLGSQLVAVLTMPATFLLIFYSSEILSVWTQDPNTVERTHLLLSLLAFSTMVNGAVNLPVNLQAAHGWTRLLFFSNVIALLVLVPLAYLTAKEWGTVGVACLGIVINGGHLIIGVSMMHRRILREEKWRWYVDDVFVPMVSACMAVALGRLLLTPYFPTAPILLILVTVYSMALVSCALTSALVRKRLFAFIGARSSSAKSTL